MNKKPSEVGRMRQMLTGVAPEQHEEPGGVTEESSTDVGGRESLNDMKLMWGPRASRALESSSGKSTGRTSFENEALRVKHFKDQKKAEIYALNAIQAPHASKGESRAALRRKKKRGPVEMTPESCKKATVEPTPQFRKRLEAFYKRYAPEKLQLESNVSTLLERFAHDPESLFTMLRAKFGPEGMQPALTISAKGKQTKAYIKADQADALLDEYDRQQSTKLLIDSTDETNDNIVKPLNPVDENGLGTSSKGFSYNTKEEMEFLDNDLDKLNAMNVTYFMQQARAKPRRADA